MIKNFRDPVHDLIRIDCPVALEIIETPAFQRLRRIRQLGLAFLTYPGAEHSRFTHSLGAYHLAIRMAESINQNAGSKIISDEQKKALGIAGLIHDIGHGPFSHLFEKVTGAFIDEREAHHENWGQRILNEDSRLCNIVAGHRELFRMVKAIFDKACLPLISDIISSELDADRFDYLLRDSLMTGVCYANLDLTWILRCLIPAEIDIHGRLQQVLALDATRGMSVVEAYVLGRHYMYKHVYYHKTTRAAERMLGTILQVATQKIADGTLLSPHPFFDELARKSCSVANYLKLDDFLLFGFIDQWSDRPDELGDLCKRLKERQIFKTLVCLEDNNDLAEKTEEIRQLARQKGLDPNLFVILDAPGDIALKSLGYYQKKDKLNKYQPLFFVSEPGGVPVELAQSESFVNSLKFEEHRIYVPDEIFAEAKSCLGKK